MSQKTMTGFYTDVARTAAVTAGHALEGAGAMASAAGCPVGRVVSAAGKALATQAVESCSRDTPSLERCNGTLGRGRS